MHTTHSFRIGLVAYSDNIILNEADNVWLDNFELGKAVGVPKPVIVNQPVNQTIEHNGRATFTVKADGTGLTLPVVPQRRGDTRRQQCYIHHQ